MGFRQATRIRGGTPRVSVRILRLKKCVNKRLYCVLGKAMRHHAKIYEGDLFNVLIDEETKRVRFVKSSDGKFKLLRDGQVYISLCGFPSLDNRAETSRTVPAKSYTVLGDGQLEFALPYELLKEEK